MRDLGKSPVRSPEGRSLTAMRDGPFQRYWSRRPRRHVRRVARLEGKLPGQKPNLGDPNPQTPFVLSPRSSSSVRKARTAFVVDLRSRRSSDPDAATSADENSDSSSVAELDA
jgi:hypothetical protein